MLTSAPSPSLSKEMAALRSITAPDSEQCPTFQPLALLNIFAPEQQICVAARAAQPAIVNYLSQHAEGIAPGERLLLDMQQELHGQLQHALPLPAGDGRQALLDDMASLVTLYADLLDCPHIGLRLEVTRQAMCLKFHIDRTGIRLLCTYLGPGTQWLQEEAVNRAAMTQQYASLEAFHHALLRPNAVIQQAPTFAVVLLKGSAWQENQQAGIVHRSPPNPSDSLRVLLALDALW